MKICLFIFYSGIFSKQEYVAGGNAVTNPACKSIALKDWQVPTVKHYLVQMILLATWKCNYPTVLYWPNLITAMIITVGLWQIHISTSITLSSESFWVTQNILKDKIHHSNFRGSSVWQSGIPKYMALSCLPQSKSREHTTIATAMIASAELVRVEYDNVKNLDFLLHYKSFFFLYGFCGMYSICFDRQTR